MEKVDSWFNKNGRGSLEIIDDNRPLWERDGSFLAAVSAYFVAMLLFVCVRIASGLGWFGLLADQVGDNATDVIATIIIQIIIFLIIPMTILKIFAKQSFVKTFSNIGFNRPSKKVVGYSFLLGFMFYFFNIFVASLSTIVLILFGYRMPVGESSFVGISGLLISLLITGVLPGICEEVSNRGVLMRGLASKLGIWRAVLISSLIFGLMHLNIVQAFYAAVLGVFMALAVLATRSIWTGVIIHFMNNSIGVFINHAQSNGWAIGKLFNQFLDLFSGDTGFIFYIAFIFIVYYGIVYIIHMFARDTYKANEKEYFAVFLRNNPERVRELVDSGRTVSLEDMSRTVDSYTSNLSKMRAIRFYLEGQQKPKKLNVMEKTMVFGMLFLTAVVTCMTLVWGLL